MSIPKLEFPPFHLPDEAEALRAEVRAFLKETLPQVKTEDRFASWNTRSSEFSKEMVKKGWMGSHWPKQYGGSERTFLDRRHHRGAIGQQRALPARTGWPIASRSRCAALRGSEEQRQAILPKITAGECYFWIGMSEPDLARPRLGAHPRRAGAGGFRVNGTKVWTWRTHNHYCIALVRTRAAWRPPQGAEPDPGRPQDAGVTIRPIINLAGRHDWNEVTFNDAFIPESCLIGNEGDGWLQVTSRVCLERSGPERFMQNFISCELVRVLGRQLQARQRHPGPPGRAPVDLAADVGRRRRHDAGRQSPAIEAALVKDLGTIYQQDRRRSPAPSPNPTPRPRRLLADFLTSPSTPP